VWGECVFDERSYRHKWSGPNNKHFVHGDEQDAQLVRCIWLLQEGKNLLNERKRNLYTSCQNDLARIISSPPESSSASELTPSVTTSSSEQVVDPEREMDILAVKAKIESTLDWDDERYDPDGPHIDFQERYRPPAPKKVASAPRRAATAKKRKAPVAAPTGTAVTIASPTPTVPAPAAVAQCFPPTPNLAYDYARLADGTAVMLWRDYIDDDGVVRIVPLEGRPGHRPDIAPLDPRWKREAIIDGESVVATKIQCGWARVRVV
jgi:hypothetical protein